MFHISLQLGVVEDQHWAVEELQRGKLPRSSMRWAMLRNLLRKKGHRAFISGGYVESVVLLFRSAGFVQSSTIIIRESPFSMLIQPIQLLAVVAYDIYLHWHLLCVRVH